MFENRFNITQNYIPAHSFKTKALSSYHVTDQDYSRYFSSMCEQNHDPCLPDAYILKEEGGHLMEIEMTH